MRVAFSVPAPRLYGERMGGTPRPTLRQDTAAGIYRRHLHGGAFIDPFARRAAAKEKAVGAARSAVLRLIPGTEKP